MVSRGRRGLGVPVTEKKNDQNKNHRQDRSQGSISNSWCRCQWWWSILFAFALLVVLHVRYHSFVTDVVHWDWNRDFEFAASETRLGLGLSKNFGSETAPGKEMSNVLKNVVVVGGSYVGRVSKPTPPPLFAKLEPDFEKYTRLTDHVSLLQNTAKELAQVVPATHRVSTY